MNRIFSVAAVVALALSFAVGFGPGVAAGQETAGNATATASSTPASTPTPASSGRAETSAIGTETPTETSDVEEENVTGDRLDSSVLLTDWSFSDGSFILTFENTGERPTEVTISGATQPEEGVQNFNIREERLLPGTTTVTMRVNVYGGEAAAGITSAESTREGGGLKVSTGSQGENPFANFGGTTGVLSGSGITMSLSGLAALFVVWREESGVIEA